jgi:hypothetical protein
MGWFSSGPSYVSKWPRYRVEEHEMPGGAMGWALYREDLWFECLERRRIACLPDRSEIERLRAEREAERDRQR